ncbi:MAG: glycosyltransferase family 4 protein, partial [FCB group bacterium]|nr:glycosyltransferase family 4 protein [FCB group bacterium]
TGPGGYTSDLAEYLVQQGEEVTVLTSFPHYPLWRLYPGFKQGFFPKSVLNGVKIIRCPIYIPQSPGAFKRILYDLSFTLSSAFAGLFTGKYDIIYCISPPLTIGLTANFLSLLKKCPFIFHIMDLVPDTPIALGMLNNQAVINMLYSLERYVYKNADGIVAISPGYLRNLADKHVPLEKAALLPNWIDIDVITPGERVNNFRQRNKLDGHEFLVTYAGNMGNKQGLETLLQAAELIQNGNKNNVKFLMVGEGARKKFLLDYARRRNLKNVIFLPLQPAEDFPGLLSASDALVITQRSSVVDICLPGKLMTNCASGRPILAAVNRESETARFINEAGCGIIVEPEKPVALLEGILKLKDSPDLARSLGAKGRKYVENFYSRDKVLNSFHHFIKKIAEIH